MVIFGKARTSWLKVDLDVPQCSVLEPQLYLLYTADIFAFFTKHRIVGHLCSDDAPASLQCLPSEQMLLLDLMVHRIILLDK